MRTLLAIVLIGVAATVAEASDECKVRYLRKDACIRLLWDYYRRDGDKLTRCQRAQKQWCEQMHNDMPVQVNQRRPGCLTQHLPFFAVLRLGDLPVRRAKSCAIEFQKMLTRWSKYVLPPKAVSNSECPAPEALTPRGYSKLLWKQRKTKLSACEELTLKHGRKLRDYRCAVQRRLYAAHALETLKSSKGLWPANKLRRQVRIVLYQHSRCLTGPLHGRLAPY